MAYTGFTSLGVDRYRQAVKVLRSVTTAQFTPSQGYDLRKLGQWSPAMERQVRRYWREYDHLTASPHELYSTKNKSKLVAVQSAALHQHYLGKFKYAFIPTNGKDKPKISFDKDDNVVFQVGLIRKITLEFNQHKLAKNPDKEVQRILSTVPDAETFRIQCGQYEYTQTTFTQASQLSKQVKQFQNTYENHPSWLKGIVAYYFDIRKDFDKYTRDTDNIRKVIAEKRASIRRKLRYAKNQLTEVRFNIRLYNKTAKRYRVEGFLQKQLDLVPHYESTIKKLETELANVGRK